MQIEGKLSLNKINRILYITFSHPKGNSLPGYLLDKLTEAIKNSAEESDINVIILQSEGEGAFCGGASFEELLSINDLRSGKKFFMGFADLINAIRVNPKCFVARVQGKVVGGGLGLVSACDYAIATKNASVKLSELALGIGPFVIAPAIERKVGKETLSAMTWNYDWRDAQWALSKGLYDDIVENLEELDLAVRSLADKLSRSNPDAIKELKKIFWENTDHWDSLLEKRAEISGRLVLSPHTREYINNFRNRIK